MPPSSEWGIVSADHVSRTYDGGRVRAVVDVSLTIRAGDFLAITGQSGSGKSTLLSLLSGLDRPTEGRIFVDSQEPASRCAWATVRARRIGMIFQSFNVLPALTACENVEMPMFGVVRAALERRRRALVLLEEVGLADRAHHRPTEMSGGERQRVAIARSLANAPGLLLADEPTGSLDSKSAASILRLLTDLQRHRQMALVIVTHDHGIAASAARRRTMIDGAIVNGEE
jgi:putative ABC transport system ATP-binding protein